MTYDEFKEVCCEAWKDEEYIYHCIDGSNNMKEK